MRYCLLFFVSLFISFAWGQSFEIPFRGLITNSDLGKKEGGVKISIVQNGSVVGSAVTASNGKFKVKGTPDQSQPFELVISKSGFVSKRMKLDFSKMNPEDAPPGNDMLPNLEVDIFKERDGVDFSFLEKEPVAYFDWDSKKLTPRLDRGGAAEMRNRIQKLLDEAENAADKLEADYQAAIAAGDQAYAEKRYEDALSSFEGALGYKPNEKYPADKILELDALIRDQKDQELAEKQANQEYFNLIEAADNLRDAGNLEKAVSTYKEAAGKRPEEQYPKDQIAAIQAQIDEEAKAAKTEEAYQAAIKSGDVFMKQNSLRPARDKFEEASKLKPNEAYPKEKLKEIEEKMSALEEQEALKKKYTEAIAAGDAAYDTEDFKTAKEKYEEALTYESSSTYAKGRITMCDEALSASQAEQERLAKIQELLDKGNADLGAAKYDDAIAAFSEVLTLDAENAEATTKLAEAQQKLEELANQAELENQYAAFVAEGDEANAAAQLEDALVKYEAAKALKDTPEVNEKIAGVQEAINQAKAAADKEATYNALIVEAESKFGADDFQGAIDKYNEAIAVDGSKPEPAEKILEIQKLLDERAAEQAKSDQFAALMKEGNDLLASDDLQNAKLKFQEALAVDATSPEPQVKIDEIDAMLAENAAEQEKNEQFAALMKEGNDLIASGELENAKSKFQEASSVDTTSPEPQAKIDEIDALIAQNLADEQAQEKQEALNAAIAAADKLFNEANWEDAQAKYREVMTIDPANQYAQNQISEIDAKIAEEKTRQQIEVLLADAQSLRENSKLEDARSKYQEVLAIDPSNTTATAQIDEINSELAALQNEEQKEQAFAALKEEGMQLFSDSKLIEAKQKLSEALAYKSDSEIEQAIVEIEKQIAENQEQEAQAQRQAEMEEQYAGWIQDAEASEANENFAAAIASYEKASGVKPNEELPKQKVQELTDLMADLQANASLNEKYTNALTDAQTFEGNGDLTSAIASYQKASDLKPDEQLPKTKISELNAQLDANAEKQAEIEKAYADAMERGEQHMASEEYLEAITAFNDALSLKPTESLPKERAAAAEEAERRKGDGDAQYEKILTVAESKIESADYDKAEELINRAKMFKPNDTRPEELLEQVKMLRARDKKYEELMASAEEEASNKNYKKAIKQFAKAKTTKPGESLPDERIQEMNRLLKDASSVNQKETLYASYMDKGQAATAGNKFVEALGHYQNALSVKPGDQVAQDKVNEIQQILDDIANADKEKLETKKKFDALIADADQLFEEKRYLDAKLKYNEALTVDSFSSYAKKRGDECARLAADAGRREAEAQYQKLLKSADKSFAEEDWEKAKDYYNRAINIRKADPYPKQKLEEIELILNPPVSESLALQPLGEEFNGTIEDGGFILQTSEETRKRNKGLLIKAELDKVTSSQVEIASENQGERLDAQNEIYAIWEKVASSTDAADDSREETIERLRDAEKERELRELQDLAFEKGDNLNAQQKVNMATDEFILNYMKGDEGRERSVEAMKGVQTSHEEKMYEQGSQYIQRKYDADQAMNQVAIKVEEEVRDDYQERLEIDKKVDAAADETEIIYSAISNSRYDNIQRQKDGVDLIQANIDRKEEEYSRTAKENNEELKEVRSGTTEVALAYMMKNDENGKEIDAEMAEVRRKVISNNEGFDKIRKDANDRLKDIQVEHARNEGIASEGQREKYLANQERLTEEERKRKDVVEMADKAMDVKVAYVNEKDRQARKNASQGELSDEASRLKTRQEIANQDIAKSQKETEGIESRKENTESLKDVKKARDAKVTAEGKQQRDKNLKAQQGLDKISNAPKKKVKVANSLGQEYPEGVSQEMFTRKDESGLVSTVITRRIVVIDGHADVYVRTETKYGITYSKNNKPSLSHVWNSETQGPHLERHY